MEGGFRENDTKRQRKRNASPLAVVRRLGRLTFFGLENWRQAWHSACARRTPMDRTPGDLLAGLERATAEAQPSAIVALLGDLERLRALLWHRLAVESAKASPAPSADSLEELRHLTPHQVGELLNLKPAYVHELCRTGRLPATKSGKYWMIPVAGLRQWLMSRNGDIDATVTERLQSLAPHADAGRVRPGIAKLGRGLPSR